MNEDKQILVRGVRGAVVGRFGVEKDVENICWGGLGGEKERPCNFILDCKSV